jgi:hypothetical protein
MKKSIVIILGLILLSQFNVQAQGVTKVGTTAAGFLGVDMGTRGTAMGSAYVSVANDVSAMYWNPSGIARINGFGANFTSTKWIADLTMNYVGLALPLGDLGTIGLNATFLRMEQIERTTIAYPEGTGEFFDAGCYAFGLSFARNLTNQFSIGMSAKYINERYYHSTATGFAIDVGTLFDTKFYGFIIGMSISNYGTKMQLNGQDFQVQHDIDVGVSGNNPNINSRLMADPYELPLMYRVGISTDIFNGWANSNLIFAVDALHPNDDVEYINVGCEYAYSNLFALRAGYKGLFAKDSEQGLNFGGGIQYEIGGTLLKVDYSYISFGILNSVHMVGIGLGM